MFPLLVYNEAGRITIICMLTEMYDATKGKLLQNNINIFESDSMNAFKELGISEILIILWEKERKFQNNDCILFTA